MKRKVIILTSIAVLVLAMTSMSFANRGYGFGNSGDGEFRHGYMFTQDYTEEELEAFHDERIAAQKDAIKSYLEEEKITQEQYDDWMTHIEDMEKFHEENGFGAGYGPGYGGCHRTVAAE